jgi:peptidoglycan/LPS O-acetylase OafA/YrhL
MQTENKYLGFDFLRGFAAFLVVISHLRNFLFVDFSEVVNPSLFDQAFYFVTGLGHQAVMVFFVLSGFFVGGSVWNKIQAKKFKIFDYLIIRMSRLWIVLLPALLFTLLCDYYGSYLVSDDGYNGAWHPLLSSGPGVGEDAIDLGFSAFFGNLLFLQTMVVPVYGSNGPLWSLAYEFWYYIAFPLLAFAILEKKLVALLALLVLMLVLYFANPGILIGFSYWLLGWLASMAITHFKKPSYGRFLLAALFFLAMLTLSKFTGNIWGEVIVAISTGVLLLSLTIVSSRNQTIANIVSKFSDFSYSLYLFHFPFMAFYWFVLVAPVQFQPSILAYAHAFVLLMVCLAFCFLMYWIFERRTLELRNWMLRKFSTNS